MSTGDTMWMRPYQRTEVIGSKRYTGQMIPAEDGWRWRIEELPADQDPGPGPEIFSGWESDHVAAEKAIDAWFEAKLAES